MARRLNMPPAGATYFDPNLLMCVPCQYGSQNLCQTVAEAPPPDDGSSLDWVFTSARAAVSACCKPTMDDVGQQVTVCDVTQGCGWTPSATGACTFVTTNATYPTLAACMADYPAPSVEVGTRVDWYPPCAAGQTNECFFDSMDSCLPQTFPAQRSAAPLAFVCTGSGRVDASGNRTFSQRDCSQVTK